MKQPYTATLPVAAAPLNTCGLLCPLPIIKTAERMKELRVGEIVELLADDPGVLLDMPAWCTATGHLLLDQAERNGVITMHVQKKGRGITLEPS